MQGTGSQNGLKFQKAWPSSLLKHCTQIHDNVLVALSCGVLSMTAVSVWIIRIEACLWEWLKDNSLVLQDKIKLHQLVLVLLTKILTTKINNLVANLSVVVLHKDHNLLETICDNQIQLNNIQDKCNRSLLGMDIMVLHIPLDNPKLCRKGRFTETWELMDKALLTNLRVYQKEVIATWWTLIFKTKVNKCSPKYPLSWMNIARPLIELHQSLSSDI